ncbi:unnamed protein product [Cunninghamella blakesleeana]
MLIPKLNFDLYCRVSLLEVSNIQKCSTCLLFILTENQTYFILRYDPSSNVLITEANGTLADENKLPLNDHILITKDPQNSLIIVSAYLNTLTLFDMDKLKTNNDKNKGKGKASYPDFMDHGTMDNDTSFQPRHISIGEQNISCMVFIGGYDYPTIAMKYKKNDGNHIKFYHIDLYNSNLNELYTVVCSIEHSVHLLIPIPKPYAGVVAIGEYTITYYSLEGSYNAISIDAVMITSYCFMNDDPHQCILGDTSGTLYLLTMKGNGHQLNDLYIQYLDETSVCTSIICLGSNLIYIGSKQGDSVLKKIIEENKKLNLVTIENFPNLGPISDFCHYDLNKQGRQTMVCCSGVNNNGSLSVVQNGYDFYEVAFIPIGGVQKVWSLSLNESETILGYGKIMIMSMINSTRVFYYKNNSSNGLKEERLSNILDLTQPTILFSHLDNGNVLQITPFKIQIKKLLDSESDIIWYPLQGTTIRSAVMRNGYIVIACTHGSLIVFQLTAGHDGFDQINTIVLSYEISCLDLNIFSNGTAYVAIGTWGEKKVQLLSFPELGVISIDRIAELVPYDIRFQIFQNVLYLFVSFGNGTIIHYKLKNMELTDQQQISIGIRPVTFFPIVHNGENVLLAGSDQPIIINSAFNQLIFTSVNIKNLITIASCNIKPWERTVLMVTDDAIRVGTIGGIKKVHSTKISLNKKMGRRIAYHEDTQSIILGTSQMFRNPDSGVENYKGWVHLYDAHTYKEMDMYELMENELIESICITRVFEEEELYIFVGTIITNKPEENGRIIMYKIKPNNKLYKIDSISVPGVVYSIKPYMNSIIASISGSIYYLKSIEYETKENEKLIFLQKTDSKVAIIDMDTHQDLILTGDILHSMSLMKLENINSPNLVTVAEDSHTFSMTAVKLLKNDICLGCDSNHNLLAMEQQYVEEENKKNPLPLLDIVGRYHIGDSVNKIKEGSLLDKFNIFHKSKKSSTLTYVTMGGQIGVIHEITENEYEALLVVQQKLTALMPSVGDLNHASWRGIQIGNKIYPSKNFLDGDLLERYLSFTPNEKYQVVKDLPCNVEQLELKIHCLSRLR